MKCPSRAKDKLTGSALSDFFIDKMLADPMVRLVVEAVGVSEVQLRHLYLGSRKSGVGSEKMRLVPESKSPMEVSSIQVRKSRPN